MIDTAHIKEVIDSIDRNSFYDNYICGIIKLDEYSMFFSYGFDEVPQSARNRVREELQKFNLDLALDNDDVLDYTVRVIMSRAIRI